MALNLEELQEQALRELSTLSDSEGLEAWRVKYLGRKGSLPQLLRGLKNILPSLDLTPSSRGLEKDGDLFFSQKSKPPILET
jgi:hypothetical protein